jgi:predicted DNA-binding ArsR family transcriptional regulator
MTFTANNVVLLHIVFILALLHQMFSESKTNLHISVRNLKQVLSARFLVPPGVQDYHRNLNE